MFSKQVENTGGKGEIARYEQVLLFSQCFQRTCIAHLLKLRLVWDNKKKPFISVFFFSKYSIGFCLLDSTTEIWGICLKWDYWEEKDVFVKHKCPCTKKVVKFLGFFLWTDRLKNVEQYPHISRYEGIKSLKVAT